ncbi:MAG: bifunctional SulP family inorganic anion transporter/carbonic anhydrase [Saprospiraceae bacterium]|nr:bifunctional SulP family inorganic anion transporter/carbonic anhydrase [Saprospiraceae bacterium]
MDFTKLNKDIPASIVVFLVALPLCLGIALASGAPLLSGLISGIIGGIVVGVISKSHSSVSGPAAGLSAIVLSAITSLGQFDTFLLVVVIAGALQLISGILKTGFIADYIPSNVIKGLLAAIGIILILKQIPHAVGLDRDAVGDLSFNQLDGENTLSELIATFDFLNFGAIIVSLLSLLIMIYWDKTPLKKLSFFPSSLFVVLFGIFLNWVFSKFEPSLYIEPSHLVNIPKIDNIAAFITTPNFGAIGSKQVWLAAVTLAIVASLETLLNLEAVERIDPHKRIASPNRELVAQGIGNIFSGLIGGIPITSVIVRSSVNLNAGGETKLSTILHGVLLLLSVLFLSQFLNLIPLASLAAILLLTGYKLAKISLFKEMYQKGWNQFIPFVVTIVAIVFTDLLIGILIGLIISIYYLLKSNLKNPFKYEKETINIGETIRLELSNQVSFLNKASIKESLWDVPNNSKVIIDATNSNYIDYDVLEIITDFKDTVSKERNIQLNVIGLKEQYQLDDHIQFVNVVDTERQKLLTPDDILNLLKIGNERFVNGKATEKYLRHQVNATSTSQNPFAVIVSCVDSRTAPELIFDAGLGDIISIRIAGNIISNEIIGSIELACQKIGTKLIVVLGHSACGAISSAINSVKNNHIHSITDKIDKAIIECKDDIAFAHDDTNKFNKIVKVNVKNSVQDILTGSNYLNSEIKAGNMKIVAAFYDTTNGAVTFFENV